jgi:hypothetical protein
MTASATPENYTTLTDVTQVPSTIKAVARSSFGFSETIGASAPPILHNQQWGAFSGLESGRTRAGILNKFLLKSIDRRIHVPLFLDGQTCIGP